MEETENENKIRKIYLDTAVLKSKLFGVAFKR
jgi:hypothetical protein